MARTSFVTTPNKKRHAIATVIMFCGNRFARTIFVIARVMEPDAAVSALHEIEMYAAV